jgi:hypothetical protein
MASTIHQKLQGEYKCSGAEFGIMILRKPTLKMIKDSGKIHIWSHGKQLLCHATQKKLKDTNRLLGPYAHTTGKRFIKKTTTQFFITTNTHKIVTITTKSSMHQVKYQ